jgi:hypothetical protein
MRIFRTILILTGAAVLMPTPPEEQTYSAQAEVSGAGLIGSASMAVADAASFCSRQPQVCETAGYVAGKLEAKAKYGVRLIYEWAAESNDAAALAPLGNQADASDPIETGTTTAAAQAGQPGSTLRIEDLVPPWRGPAGPKKS